MHQSRFHPAWLAGLALSVALSACGRDRDRAVDEGRDPAVDTRALPEASMRDAVEVTGCITANYETNQFVLTTDRDVLTSTAHRAAGGGGETYAYQLAGGPNLQEHVGQQVVVSGTLEGDVEQTQFEDQQRTEEPATVRRGEEVTPTVESTAEIDVRMRRLHVAEVTPTGLPCGTTP